MDSNIEIKPSTADVPKPTVSSGDKQEDKNLFRADPSLIEGLDLNNLPIHIAFIMDGNRRWARDHSKHSLEGHRAGVKALREVVEGTLDINELTQPEKRIQYLTFYAFSKENWNRSYFEVDGLMQIFERAAVEELLNLHKRNIKIKIIGSVEDLPASLMKRLNEMVELTSHNTGLNMHFALSYSGRWEIVKAVRRMAKAVIEDKLNPDDLDESMFQKFLETWDAPDPDLLIRTSGEMRISNFLLWQLAYTEIYVTNIYWPDFSRMTLVEALRDFQARSRRYGAD